MLIVTAVVYLPALGGGFVADDADQIVLAHTRLAWHAVPVYFKQDVWSYLLTVPSNYYRPVFLIWLTINYKLFGLEPIGWHIAALTLHLAATLLFYFLAQRLTRDQATAGIAALLFGVHPVHVETVAWLSGVTDSLLAVWIFGAILCFLRAPERPRTRWGWESGALALFAIALCTKETAVVLPALLAIAEWLRDRRPRVLNTATRIAPYVAILLLYLAVRIHVLGGTVPVARAWTPLMVANTLPSVLLFYLRQLAVPLDVYSFLHPLEAVREFNVARVVFPAALVIAAVAEVVWIARRGPAAMFSLALLVLPLLPVLNLRAFLFDDIVHDRYLYLPSAGLCILLAMGIVRLTTIFQSPVRGLVQAGVAIALAIVLSFVTIKTTAYWADDLALFTRAVTVAPDSAIAAEYLAGTLSREQRCGEALPLLKRALAVDMAVLILNIRTGRLRRKSGRLGWKPRITCASPFSPVSAASEQTRRTFRG